MLQSAVRNRMCPLKRRGTLYYNVTAGSWDAAVFDPLIVRAREEGMDAVAIDESVEIARDIRTRIDRGHELFIIAGGDGSIHHAIQGLARSNATLAIIPIGTFNHLAKDLGIPLEPAEAFEVALHGETISMDLGVVDGRYFANNLLLGIYPEIVRRRESLRRHYSKWRAYWHAVRYAIKRFPHVNVQIESQHHLQQVKAHIFAIAVNEYDLGNRGVLAPKRSFNSGRLTIYWIPYRPKWSYLPTLARYLRGKIQPGTELRSVSTQSVRITSARPELKAGMDGELVNMPTPFQAMIVPGGLRVRTGSAESGNGRRRS